MMPKFEQIANPGGIGQLTGPKFITRFTDGIDQLDRIELPNIIKVSGLIGQLNFRAWQSRVWGRGGHKPG
jgi:hypothetical protein